MEYDIGVNPGSLGSWPTPRFWYGGSWVSM